MRRACFIATVAILASISWLSSTLARAGGPGPPELYFYPPPYKLPNGSLSPSILTVAPEQITDLFPSVKEMDGVVLLVAWNQLCPRANSCDFSLIDRVLNYWGPRGKKVILSLSTMGLPVKVMVDGRERFLEETPEWATFDEDFDDERFDFSRPSAFDRVSDDVTDDTAEDQVNGHHGDLAEEYGTATESDPWSQEERAIAEEAGSLTGGLPEAENYDDLSLPQLRARLRRFSSAELAELLDYEKANGNRPSFVGMLTRRIATVRDQR